MLRKIFRVYRYIYYREYLFFKKNTWDISPHTSALFDMVIVFVIYLTLFSLIISKQIGVDIDSLLTKNQWFFIYFLIHLAHYFLFNYKKKYLLLEKEFINENKKQRYINGWLVVTYSVGSIIFMFALILYY